MSAGAAPAAGAAAAAMGGDPAGGGAPAGGGDPNAGGGGAPSWDAGYSEDHRATIGSKGWKSHADVMDGYIAAEKHIGSDPKGMLKMPTGPEDLEGIARFRTAIGVPETHEGYKLEGVELYQGEDSMLPQFQQWAHSRSLNEDQASGLAQDFQNFITESEQALEAEFQKTSKAEYADALVDWGNKADENLQRVKRFTDKNGIDANQLERAIGTKKFLELGLAVDLATGEHTMGNRDGGSPPPGGGGAVAAGLAEIKAMTADGDFMAKFGRKDPDAVSRWHAAHVAAYGEEKAL